MPNDQEKTYVTSIRLKKSILKKAKLIAVQRDITVGKLIEELIEKESRKI